MTAAAKVDCVAFISPSNNIPHTNVNAIKSGNPDCRLYDNNDNYNKNKINDEINNESNQNFPNLDPPTFSARESVRPAGERKLPTLQNPNSLRFASRERDMNQNIDPLLLDQFGVFQEVDFMNASPPKYSPEKGKNTSKIGQKDHSPSPHSVLLQNQLVSDFTRLLPETRVASISTTTTNYNDTTGNNDTTNHNDNPYDITEIVNGEKGVLIKQSLNPTFDSSHTMAKTLPLAKTLSRKSSFTYTTPVESVSKSKKLNLAKRVSKIFSPSYFNLHSLADSAPSSPPLPMSTTPLVLSPNASFLKSPNIHSFLVNPNLQPSPIKSSGHSTQSLIPPSEADNQSISETPSPRNNGHFFLTPDSGSFSSNRTSNFSSSDDFSRSNSSTSVPVSQSGSIFKKPKSPRKSECCIHYKSLDAAFSKFQSKTGLNKANALRLGLLSFLRMQPANGENCSPSNDDTSAIRAKKIKILHKWWAALLASLRDRENPVSNADRSAYFEGISGLVSRSEWTHKSSAVSVIVVNLYQSLLTETLSLVLDKLSLKTVPISMAAFSGKVLAFAFFFLPGVADVLLYLLGVSQENIDRIFNVSLKANPTEDFGHLVQIIRPFFPNHVANLLGLRKSYVVTPKARLPSLSRPSSQQYYCPKGAPPCPKGLPDIYGIWVGRWASFHSDVFYSFLKHYYNITSSLLSCDMPKMSHLTSPGLIVIHGFLLQGLDSIVHPSRIGMANGYSVHNLNTTRENIAIAGRVKKSNLEINAKWGLSSFASSNCNRFDNLALLACIREILHNNDPSIPFYATYCEQFEIILHAIALQVSAYDVESCALFLDLVEEYLSTLTLASHPTTAYHVKTQKDTAINWKFWVEVTQRMMSCENNHTELRAISFLFNIWDHIPMTSNKRLGGRMAVQNEKYHQTNWGMPKCQDSLRWSVVVWLLGSEIWRKYFCHWQPLVRAYYIRLLCWRVGSVGSDSGLNLNILFSSYNVNSRRMLKKQLKFAADKFSRLVEVSMVNNRPLPDTVPSPPMINRRLAIISNNLYYVPSHGSLPKTPQHPQYTSSGMYNPKKKNSSSENLVYNRRSNGVLMNSGGEISLAPELSLDPFRSSYSPPRKMNAYDIFDNVAYSCPINNSSSGPSISGSDSSLFEIKGSNTVDLNFSHHDRQDQSHLMSPYQMISGDSGKQSGVSKVKGGNHSDTNLMALSSWGVNSLKKKWSIFKEFSKLSLNGIEGDNGTAPKEIVIANPASTQMMDNMTMASVNTSTPLSSISRSLSSSRSSSDSSLISDMSSSSVSCSSLISNPSSVSSSRTLTSVSSSSSPSSPESLANYQSNNNSNNMKTPTTTAISTQEINRRGYSHYKSTSGDSLTMSLVPPPPQILRKTPEVIRPSYKFHLEISELEICKHQDLLYGKHKRKIEVHNNQKAKSIKPRLPFDTTMSGNKPFGSLASAFDVSFNEFDDYGTSDEDNDDMDDGDADISSSRTKIHGPETKEEKSDNIRYWRYVGKAISEWDLAVREFEEFVRCRKMMNGVVRLEDMEVPFLVAEIPSKAFAG